MSVMLRGDGGERHAKHHLAPKCGPVRKLVEFGPVELDGLLARGKSKITIYELWSCRYVSTHV